MKRITGYLASLVLGFSLLGTVAITGCAARVGVYDPEYRDYHRWNRDEDRAYHNYWRERHEHEDYRDYSRLNAGEQHDYWNWRHGHPDEGRRNAKDDNRDRDRR